MIIHEYKPDFFNQEYVEKLMFENFPSSKVNDITSFHCMNFHEVLVQDGSNTGSADVVLYYGFISTNDKTAVNLYCLLLDSSVDVVTLDCFPLFFPLITLGCFDDSVPTFFTGWKLTCTSALIPSVDTLPVNYGLLDSLLTVDQGADTYRSGSFVSNISAIFANASSPKSSFHGETLATMDGTDAPLYVASSSVLATQLILNNHSSNQRVLSLPSSISYFDSHGYVYDEAVSGFSVFNLHRAGVITLKLFHLDGSGDLVDDGYIKNSYGSDYNSLSVLPGVLSLSYSGVLQPKSLLHVVFIDAALGVTVDVYHKVASTWVVSGNFFWNFENYAGSSGRFHVTVNSSTPIDANIGGIGYLSLADGDLVVIQVDTTVSGNAYIASTGSAGGTSSNTHTTSFSFTAASSGSYNIYGRSSA